MNAIEEHALTPEAIEQVIRLAERDDIAEQRLKLERDLKDSREAASAGLAGGHRNGGRRASLRWWSKVRELEAGTLGTGESRRWPCTRCLGWHRRPSRTGWPNGGDCRGHRPHGHRAVLRRILEWATGAYTPRSDSRGLPHGLRLRRARPDSRSCSPASSASDPKDWFRATRTGCEGITPEDTFDAEYGRLLDRASDGAN
ncbi:MAG: hypothetical protein MZV64_72590 [Ignavibacteriales bacterium]|nr:hypothetical protein [Ignavibacteriales bacterium]